MLVCDNARVKGIDEKWDHLSFTGIVGAIRSLFYDRYGMPIASIYLPQAIDCVA
jgi:hypothetical protein